MSKPGEQDTGPASEGGSAPWIATLGDSAVVLTLADTLDFDANRRAFRIAREIRSRSLQGVADVVPALTTVTVYFDARTQREAVERRAALERALGEALDLVTSEGAHPSARTVEIPVCYEPPHAVDLPEVAAHAGLAPREVVELHASSKHCVLMIGFAPGHAYVGGLDARLAMPRRGSPRHRVEPGSVAIANLQTSIYPFATPGGWNVIGRTPLVLFDPARVPATLLEAGDAVVFTPITAAEFERIVRERPG
ncbi:MAG: 5-oxoprolinase subunit PxpB [Betaproteobacteria bacterium]|nr:5-oxoprolinase subunit PxpB [Betaproteobacteria bacterium]